MQIKEKTSQNGNYWMCLLFIVLFSYPVQAQNTVDQFMGVNTRRQDPVDRMQAVGIIREYHDWYLNEGFPFIPYNENGSPGHPNSQYKWNKVYQNLDYTHFDDFYKEIKDSSITICPATLGNILQVIDPTIPFNDPNIGQILEQKPIIQGADPQNPASYIAHAEYLYHYAARYGNTSFSSARTDSIITPKLHPSETAVTGLGYVEYLEDWNEQDKNYYPYFPKTYFSPEEYAAMLSADFDGHEKTLGLMNDPDNLGELISTVGIKNADPGMKVVMGGLTDADLDYIRNMVDWFKLNRSNNADFGQIPLDVLNIHIYVGNNEPPLASTAGISPESAGLKQILSKFVNYRDSLMPGIELWLSEFGYDTNQNSPIRVPAIGENDHYEVQAQWIIRFYLETLAAGFDRAMLYDLRDICTQPACALFQSSGLLESADSNYRPKNSWYYEYTMKNVLKDMVFDADLSGCSDTTCTRIYRFTQPGSTKKVYAVWSPTSSDTSYQYALSLEGESEATLVKLEKPSIYGVSSNIQGTNPTINVRESPVFIITGEENYYTSLACPDNLNTSNLTCGSVNIEWSAPVESQAMQLWKMKGHVSRTVFSTQPAYLVDDQIDAISGNYTIGNLSPSTDYTFFLIPQGIGISDTSSYCSVQVTTSAVSCKIPIDSSWIFDAYLNPSDAYKLIDEQDLFDPLCQDNSLPTSIWGTNFQDSGQERLSLDLQDYYFIDAITVYDAAGIGFITLEMADSPNGPWTTIKEYQTIGLNEWKTFTNLVPLDIPVRYLRVLASTDDQAQIGELFLCGRLSEFTTDLQPGKAKNVNVQGSNCFSVNLSWAHPFDQDISHYEVIFGNEVRQFSYTPTAQEVLIDDLKPDTNYTFSIVTIDSAGQSSDTITVSAATLTESECMVNCNISCPCQICLSPSWISAEDPSNTTPHINLIDEQETAPLCSDGSTPNTSWGWDFNPANPYPVSILDRQQAYQLHTFHLYDLNGADTFRVEYKDAIGNWVLLFDYYTIAYNSWVSFEELNVTTRFLRFSKLNNGAAVSEIALCGFPACLEPDIILLSQTICTGDSLLFNGQYYKTTGLYIDTLKNISDCDSIVKLTLNVLDTVQTQLSASICQGSEYTFNASLLTESGTYRDTLTATNGCDSTVVLSLHVLQAGDSFNDGNPNTFNDQLDQDCNCTGIYLNPQLCEVDVSVNLDTIWVRNLIQPITILNIYNDDWSEVVYGCGFQNCNISEYVTNLPDGTYHVKVESWSAEWAEKICDVIIDVEISTAPPPICDTEILSGEDFIRVNNLDEPLVSMHVFSGDFVNTLFFCDYGDCNISETLSGLSPGAYVVKVHSFTDGFKQEVCNLIQTVVVGNSVCYTDPNTFFFGSLPKGTYQSQNTIISKSIIEEDASVVIKAGHSITLGEGFHAVAGSRFTAAIENCNTFASEESNVPLQLQQPAPSNSGLLKVVPNPFKYSTSVIYRLEKDFQNVSLSVHDMTGRVLHSPVQNIKKGKGLHSFDLQLDGVPPGMLLAILKVDGFIYSKKIVLLK